jgi:hypothetical protein
MSDFSLKKRYEAVLLRLKSQQIELLVQITDMLENPSGDLSEVQELVEDYTQIEGAFMTFKQTIGDYINAKEAENAPPPPPEEKPLAPDPESSKVVTPEMSPTMKRSQTVKRVRKKKTTPAPKQAEGEE